MSSEDVLHSFFLPAMRVKRDVLPGRLQMLWFEATELGIFPLFCTEYCGERHSMMIGEIHVVSQEEFERGTKNLDYGPKDDPNLPLPERGKRKFVAKGCVACHSDKDPNMRAPCPSFVGLWGREEEMTDGTKVVVDEKYFVESVMKPLEKTVKGYVRGSMAPQVITEDEVKLIMEYVKTLK